MSIQKLSQQVIGSMLITLLLVGCKDPATTHTPVPSTATPIPTPKLTGDANDPATAAIPELDFTFREQDYSDNHPELPGPMISFNTLFLVFTLDTTVGEANAIIEGIGAEIVGGIPGSVGQLEGILLLRLPTTTHEEMIAILDQLDANPKVTVAVQDILLENQSIPESSASTPAGWVWDLTPKGGNWGLEIIRAPQMWNFNDAITKANTTTIVGILDDGFSIDHPDLNYLENLSLSFDWHGTHVAGIVGARYANGGVQGVNPFAQLVVSSAYERRYFDFLTVRNDLRVVNRSWGINWWKDHGIDPNTDNNVQSMISKQGLVFKLTQLLRYGDAPDTFIVTSAGNDSASYRQSEARWTSPFNYAALELDVNNILVVEAVELSLGAPGDATRAQFSNVGGHLSAPGVGILSTSYPLLYESKQGTSMAAPHVTGLVSYLLALDPSLTNTELRRLLLNNTVAVGGAASPRIDAFASAMDIDRKQANTEVLRKLVDIDDGTLDGNQRVLCDGCPDFEEIDVDGDGGPGDGSVDMADFRTWRDWLLQIEAPSDLALDGTDTHPKRDINKNGDVTETPAEENRYPRGDFNGDGIMDQGTTKFVPGSIFDQVTDLDVLAVLFDDPHYQASELPGLIYSADLDVNAETCLTVPEVIEVRSTLYFAGTDTVVEDRLHTVDEPRHIYTAALNPGGYTLKVEAYDSSNKVVGFSQEDFPFELGSDAFFEPLCGSITIDPEVLEIRLNVNESSVETVRLISNHLWASYEVINSVAYVELSNGQGIIEQDTEEILGLTFTCPEDAGDYPRDLELSFTDDQGSMIPEGVPEILDIGLRCLEGGVTAEPDPLNLTAEVDETISSDFHLRNLGTALNYQSFASAPVSITNNASGILEEEGEVIVSLTATCPSVPGLYVSTITLQFARDDGGTVDVEVPSDVTVNLNCIESQLIEIVSQKHWAGLQLAYPYEARTETYTSTKTLDAAAHIVYTVVGNVEGNVQWDNTVTSIPVLGFTEVSIVNDLSGADIISDWAGERTRTENVSVSYDFSSTYEEPFAAFNGTISGNWIESEYVPQNTSGAGQASSSGTTEIVFDLETTATVDASWSCMGEFTVIHLMNVNHTTFVFTRATDPDCSYSGVLTPGRYLFFAQSIFYGEPFNYDVHSASQNGSYSLIVTINE